MPNNKIYSDYLMHYRTKGSRNGYSKDPNYTPVGQKAMTPLEREKERRKGSITTSPRQKLKNDPLDYDSRKDDPDYVNRGRYFDDDSGEWRNNYDLSGKAKFKMLKSSVSESLPENPIRRVANEVRSAKKDAERSKQQDANIEYQRKRAQQAREDRTNAARTRYAQQEAIEATKAGHGKAPTSGKSGRVAAGLAIADAASAAAKAAVEGRNRAMRARARARVTADQMANNFSDMAKKSKVAYYHNELQKSKKISDERNSRSDIGNALADAKSDVKKLVNKGKEKVSKLLKKFR